MASVLIKLVIATTRGASEMVILALPLLVGAISFVSLVGALARTMHEGPPKPATS